MMRQSTQTCMQQSHGTLAHNERVRDSTPLHHQSSTAAAACFHSLAGAGESSCERPCMALHARSMQQQYSGTALAHVTEKCAACSATGGTESAGAAWRAALAVAARRSAGSDWQMEPGVTGIDSLQTTGSSAQQMRVWECHCGVCCFALAVDRQSGAGCGHAPAAATQSTVRLRFFRSVAVSQHSHTAPPCHAAVRCPCFSLCAFALLECDSDCARWKPFERVASAAAAPAPTSSKFYRSHISVLIRHTFYAVGFVLQ